MKEINTTGNKLTLLLADDDEDDVRLTSDALKQTGATIDLRYVENGEELLQYLRRQGRYSDSGISPEPVLILLDLNMPIKDGRESLAEMKADPALRHLAVVVFTTSTAKEDIQSAYDLGVNSFITKPTSYTGLVDLMGIIHKYWIESVQHPIPRVFL